MSVPKPFFLLPPNAVNVDTESEPEGGVEELTYERLLKKVVEHGTELLAVSDLSFYYVDYSAGRVKYVSRDKLYDILTGTWAKASPLLKTLRSELASQKTEVKPLIALALLSPDLPLHLFERDGLPVQPEELPAILAEYGKSLEALEFVECEPRDSSDESVYVLFYGSFLKALELLRVKYGYGVSNGEPCIIVDRKRKTGIVILTTPGQ